MKIVIQKIISLWNCETTSFKWCVFTISISLGIVLGAALLVFTVDPHYRYRKPFFYDTVYNNIYATAPHILEHEEYDLLMLGTSMTRNFFLSDIDSAFNCKSVKLAASGGTAEDLCKFMDTAIQAKKDKLKAVIFSLDIYSLNKTKAYYLEFDYMYRKNYTEDYRYLFSRQAFSSILYLLKRKLRPKKQRAHQTDRNRMFSTEYKGKKYGLEEVIDDARHNAAAHHTQTPYNPQAFQKNFYGRMLKIFDSNPRLRFTVYLPPYHIYTWCQSEHFKEADALIRQRSQVMLELLKRPNVTLHDFQADSRFVENHAWFSDVQHFSNIAACELLKELKLSRRRIATAAHVAANEKELRLLIKKNMKPYFGHLKENGR